MKQQKILTDEEMADEIRAEIHALGNAFRFANLYGIHNAHLYKFLSGKVPMQPQFAEPMG